VVFAGIRLTILLARLRNPCAVSRPEPNRKVSATVQLVKKKENPQRWRAEKKSKTMKPFNAVIPVTFGWQRRLRWYFRRKLNRATDA